jgi:SpoVK/Ycf46/Vps4 family AAA+-type ATPase
MNERLHQHVGRIAGLLADLIAASVSPSHDALTPSVSFLRSTAISGDVAHDPMDALAQLSEKLELNRVQQDLVVLAGMPEFHEGMAAIFRSLHPRGESRPTVGLAAQLFRLDYCQRSELREYLEDSGLSGCGVVRAIGDAPFFERTLQLGEALWPVLNNQDRWPESLSRRVPAVPLAGLDDWLALPAVRRAQRALRNHERCTVVVLADSEDLAFERGLALVQAAARSCAGFQLPPGDEDSRRLLEAHSLARGAVPVLRVPAADGPAPTPVDWFERYPDTAVLCYRDGASMLRTARPVLSVIAERLTVSARRKMWQTILPTFTAEQVGQLSIYGIEPAKAGELAADLECIGRLEQRPATTQDLAAALRSRTPLSQSAGVKLIRPKADWSSLVLPPLKEEQLRSALSRLKHQERVLDDWGFMKGRPGARGVRMLFSGPPGTGKTFAAEVLAKELGCELLLVDISRVVSKWVGETEKNLANVFDTAERAQAVCFFDEADALFGRRTEVSDAHDRYANLETAYLLSRLERFEGLAILATNLRQNIDPAFLRRLEYVVDFDEPDREERFRIWECHIPDTDLLAEDVNLFEFAALYPVAGGLIRNAAVSAAFLAAANGGEITRHHLLRAVRAEYHKSGRPFPGLPPGTHL